MAVDPINMSVTRKKVPAKGVVRKTKGVKAPSDSPHLTVNRVVKDKVLEQRVASLEEATGKEIIVKLEPRPRITSISVEYDSMGHPKVLVPAYSE